MIKRLLLTGISALGLIALSSLSLPVHAQDSEELARIELAIIPQPENLDPVSVSRFDVNKQDLIENLFVGLTRIDARRGEVVPYLATDWEVSADGVTWTFNLRDDVQ